jgi:hypothetical protein
MKNSIILILGLSLLTLPLFSATTTSTSSTISTETTNNATLLNNASLSTSNLTSTGTYLKVLNSASGESETASNLTDEQKKLSESYVHQGLSNRIITEKCASEDMKQICAGQDPNSSKTALIKAVAQAYAVVGAMAGDSILSLKKGSAGTDSATKGTSTTSTSTSTATTKDSTTADGMSGQNKSSTDKKDETQTDYCKYFPAGTESVATIMQSMTTSNLSSGDSSSTDSAQKVTLLKAAKNHSERAKGAQIQAVGWYAGAACYTYMAASGTAAVNTALVIKLAAATFLGTFYQGEVSTNKGYAEKTKAVADALPGAGDCNPVTQKSCYCSQPETENDTTYCYTELHKKSIAASSTRVSCVDSSLKTDSSCKCESTNTCFEKLIINSDTTNALGYGTTSSSPFSGVRALTHGELVGGTLSGTSYASSAAIAKKGLADYSDKIQGPSSLNNDQRAMAAILQKAGIPSNAAALLASTNVPTSALDSANAKLAGTVNGLNTNSLSNAIGSTDHSVNFSGGSGLGVKGKSGSGNSNDILSKFAVPGKKDGATNNRVVEFAQEAQRKNQITRSSSTIFEIISNRYLNSATKLLELEK